MAPQARGLTVRARRLVAVALACALPVVVAGCVQPQDGDVRRTALAPGGERWAEIARTLAGPPARDAANVCTRGDRACVVEVAGEMRRRLAALERACDHDAAFALMYLTVTEGVRDGPVRFADPTYLNHLDAVFAQLYFTAFDAFRAGRDDAVPPAWRIAFGAAERREVTGLGDMLLGMNAHISRDLPFALERTGLLTADGRSGTADYDRVNALLAEVQEPMLRAASERLDPTVASFRLPALGFEAGDVATLLGSWRTEAHRNARRLLDAPTPADRAEVARSIEENAETRARILEATTAYALVGGSTARRDRFCAQRRASAAGG